MAWNVTNFLALSAALAVLATVSVALRFWAHTKSGNKVGPDDALIVAALVSLIDILLLDKVTNIISAGCNQHGNN
jgi:uncharacterized membrane protein YqhA